MFIDSDNGSGGDTSIDVRGSIQWIKNGNVFVGFGKYGFFVSVDKIKLTFEKQIRAL